MYWAEYATSVGPSRTAVAHRGIGIDLGTTNSVVSVIEGGGTVVITNAEGSETTPSVFAWSAEDTILVGAWAARQALINIDRTVRLPTYRLGADWSTRIGGHTYTPTEVTAHILRKLKRDTEQYLDETVQDVVITVPALLDNAGRRTVEKAAQMAGLSVTCLLAAPCAAALAFGLDWGEDAIVLVFDLGGATLDVCVAEIGDGVVEIHAVNGDQHLGGDNWDQCIVDHLLEEFRFLHGVDLSRDRMVVQRVREAAENAKIELSSATETSINLPYLTTVAQDPLHLDQQLTRAQFQQLTSDLLERCKTPVHNVIKDAGTRIDAIDHVILTGRATRMPAITELVEELTGKTPRRMLHPGTASAVGAALRAGINKGEVKDILLLDVTPLSLGIETKGGRMTKIIERNTTIPTKRSGVFTTAEDNQPSVQIPIYQGEREIAAFNKKLGMLELAGLPPSPRGTPQIEVAFDIDYAGRIHVTVTDLATQNTQRTALDAGDLASHTQTTHDVSRLLVPPSPSPQPNPPPPSSPAAGT
ncbi:Hsp70 family protein [Streptomyces sp. NBC_00988]|nr:Hsp70 family protein [Streptomyces sp. NBC_00988]WSX18337.1 Hsp70 family protein [Streptomyces sp. NBC_00988]